MIDKSAVESSFGGENTLAMDDSSELISALKKENGEKTIFLLMSSGDFNGTDIRHLSGELIFEDNN
ncbi:MAG: hypothetical protein R2727_04425 [Bacteroidales bacterium]